MRYSRGVAVALALLGVGWRAPVAVAAPPTFFWASPQSAPTPLPAGPAPFRALSRFAAEEPLQRFTLSLAAGATETIGVLVPAGAPPVELTVLAPDGGEFSLPSLPAPQFAWLGGIRLRRTIRYPYVATVGGTYGVVVQPGVAGSGEPYVLEGNAVGHSLLFGARPGPADVLRAPVTWLQTLLWLWG